MRSIESSIIQRVCTFSLKHRSKNKTKNVVNDEKRCVARVDKVPGLDQACTRRKKEVGGGGGGYDSLCNNSA